MDLIDLFKPFSEIPELDTSHFQPWTLDKLHQVEPALAEITARAVAQRRRRYPARLAAYTKAKHEAWELVGWYARDPRLRSQGAWDCLFATYWTACGFDFWPAAMQAAGVRPVNWEELAQGWRR